MRTKSIVSGFISLVLILGGLALAFTYFLGQSTQTSESRVGGEFNVLKVSNPAPEDTTGPADKTLTLTVPKMNRLDGVEIPDAAGDDEDALRANAGIHLQGTGFPWQEGSNVYLAGHRMGYPGTDSFLAFRDQQKLEKGDEIRVTDSEGTRYTYEVFSERIVGPEQVEVTQPVEGKNILTLQTCTFPDYSERIVTQAELVAVA